MRIDPAQNRVTATTRGLAGANGFAFSGGTVWVALHHAQSVAVLDGTSGHVLARIAVPSPGGGVTASGPSQLAAAFGSVWVSVPNLNAVIRINPLTHKITAVIRPRASCGGEPVVAGGGVWVPCDTLVARVSPRTNAVTARARLVVTGLVSLGGRLWASTPAGDIVSIDPTTGAITSRTHFNASFNEIAAADGSLWAWDANSVRVDQFKAL